MFNFELRRFFLHLFKISPNLKKAKNFVSVSVDDAITDNSQLKTLNPMSLARPARGKNHSEAPRSLRCVPWVVATWRLQASCDTTPLVLWKIP